MFTFVRRHTPIVIGLIVVIVVGSYYFISTLTSDPLAGLTTASVERGTVEQMISVSGVSKNRNAADLAFPSAGVVASIPVKEGDLVEAGTLLATLASAQQTASLNRALADVAIAEAALKNLTTGVRTEAKTITSTTVATARAEVERVTATQNLAVENARRALYSASLIARAEDTNEKATPPVISGTYRCENAGTYTLTVYRSDAQSGYSVRVTGLETDTINVGVNQAVPFGTCGLFAQFTPDDSYSNSVWTVIVPNSTSASYVTLRNALTAAENSRATAIAAANEALVLAEQKQILESAAPVPADIAAAEARVAQARAGVAELTASLADRSIIAPFGGMVTKVDILPGETAGTAPVITLLATDGYEIVARVPEIDITTVSVGQSARIIFDAAPDDIQSATVNFISPLPTEIGGVSYYEVKLLLDQIPPWLRGGLNADVDIVTARKDATLRLPRRFVVKADTGYVVRQLIDNRMATTTILVDMVGNDGFAAIAGLNLGDTVVAP